MAKKFNSGTIIKVPLEFGRGSVLAKLVDLSDIKQNPVYNELLYVYKSFAHNGDVSDAVQKLNESELLLGPIFILDLPAILRKKKWEIVGAADLTPMESDIPDFKDFGPVFSTNEDEAKTWYYIRNLEINNRIVTSFDAVKHLEVFKIYSHDMVARRITMEVIRSDGENIIDYYDLDKWENLCLFKHIEHTPMYRDIPNGIRGKAIT